MSNEIPPEVIRDFMKAAVEGQRRQQQEKETEKRIEVTVKIISAAYDKAAAYTNLIIVAGYAAIFALWGNVKQELTKGEMLWSALFLMLSLLVFILWECSSMIYNARSLEEINKALLGPPEQFEAAATLATRHQDERALRFRRFWVVTLLLTILPAIAGAAVLFRALIRQLLAGA